MEKVTTINLAGNAFQLEEDGYTRLSSYLADARAKLSGDPDVEEILNDFEHALAQKCRARLNAHKTVITSMDVTEILNEMGPVEADQESAKSTGGHTQTASAEKKLYRIRQGAMIAGVCNGLAAYFNIEVTIVRIAFIILTLFTSGAWILVYIVMIFIIPAADTPKEHAAAYGAPPITAQNLLERAKNSYEDFKNSQEWQEWKRNMQEESERWKRQWKDEMQYYGQQNKDAYTYTYSPFWSFMHSLLGLAWTVLIVVGLWYAYHHSVLAKEYMDIFGTFVGNLIELLVEKIS